MIAMFSAPKTGALIRRRGNAGSHSWNRPVAVQKKS
jgi:hypothetical protein